MGHIDGSLGNVHLVWARERPNSGAMCVENMLGYHLGRNDIIRDQKLSTGTKCYQLG